MKQKEAWAAQYCTEQQFKSDHVNCPYCWLAGFEAAKRKCNEIMADTPHARFRIDPIGEDEFQIPTRNEVKK